MIRYFAFLLMFQGAWGFGERLRIVSLAPSLTEIFCHLGLCDQLVGVTDSCLYPASVQTVPKVGSYMVPSLETIAAMKPDIILALPEHRDITSKLKRLGLRVEVVRNWSLADILASIQTIGHLMDREDEAELLATKLKNTPYKSYKTKGKRLRCLLTLGYSASGGSVNEVYAVGRNGFLNDILELAGGENAIRAETPHFPKLNQEALLALNPDVVIELVPLSEISEEERSEKEKSWRLLRFLTATRKNRYFIVHSEHVLQAGPRYVETLKQFGEILSGL